MDQPCSFAELRGCLRDIAQVNWLTGAYRPTLDWLNHVYEAMPFQEKPLQILDVGCGYGDMLRRISSWAADRNLPVVLTGIDRNPDAIRAAREATRPGTATFLAGDAFAYQAKDGVDLVVSSLLTHHMEDHEVIEFMEWMDATARLGWFINDLHRQATPYRLFRLMSRFTNWHPFVKHDGPVSILRSFRAQDWREFCKAAGLPGKACVIREYWPARLCVARIQPAVFGKRSSE
jgi:trans-aconitate methyltransferase